MTEEPGPRKLAAIMSIDIVGYSALAESDEAAALNLVARLDAVLEVVTAAQSGRVFSTAGDGFMLEFNSAGGALAAAESLWGAFERQRLRVGVHVGDVMVAPDGDLLGHSVNIAARLQQLAQPGAAIFSVDARRAVRGVLARRLHPAGAVQLDKMSETLDIFTLEAAPLAVKRTRREPVLAVLPFDNESEAAEMNYFSDGVADEIISTLLRSTTIKVIGRTSAFQFRGQKKTDAAAALKATHVLDGAVQCNAARMRVTVHLSDASSGEARWSERYEGDRADAFAFEDEIAARVASSLRRSLSERPPQSIDPAAHDLYLRARQMWLMLSDIEEDQAAGLLERCVALAPEFAPGWAMLAGVRAFLLPRDRDVLGSPAHDAALEAANRALDLDPDCAQAFVALSLLKPAFAEHGEKLRLVDEALKRTPHDASLHVARASWLYNVGRLKEAAKAMEVASLLDPLGPTIEGMRASLQSARGDAGMALEIVRPAWMRWPDSPFLWHVMWSTLCVAGRLEEAEAMAAPGTAPRRGVTEKDIAVLRRYVAALRMPASERHKACVAMLDHLARTNDALPLSTCLFAASWGCADHAFDLMFAALDAGRDLKPDNHDGFGTARSQAPLQLFVANGGAPIWRHQRFPQLAARLGLAQYWLESKKWPDCANEADYDFKAACAAAVGN